MDTSKSRKPGRSAGRRVQARAARPPAVAFGAALRTLRRRRHLSQAQLAARAGLERRFIADIERGEGEPTLVALFRLAGALGVTPSKLLSSMERRSGEKRLRR